MLVYRSDYEENNILIRDLHMSIENNFKPETHTKKKRQNCMNYK